MVTQLKLNIETSVGESTTTEAEYGVSLPIVEVGVIRLDKYVWNSFIRNIDAESSVFFIVVIGGFCKVPQKTYGKCHSVY